KTSASWARASLPRQRSPARRRSNPSRDPIAERRLATIEQSHQSAVPRGRAIMLATTRSVRGEETMSSSTMELFVAMYGDEDGARAALKDFQAAERAGSIDLIDAAVVVHTAEGKVTFEETADPSGKTWAKRGAIAGGVVGLIFPPTIIASAIAG